jgi:hypothetical protein
MKTSFFFILLFSVVSLSIAQEETLVGKGTENDGYGGPVWKMGMVNGKAGLLMGGRGAWIINHKFAIGGGGYNLTTEIETKAASDGAKAQYLQLEYGGLELEYIHNSSKLVHWTFLTLLGGGTVRSVEKKPEIKFEEDNFTIIEPGASLDLNVNTWLRIGLGASYRIAIGVNSKFVTNADISGPSAVGILKFGGF